MKISQAKPEDFDEFNKVFPQTDQGRKEFEIGTKNDGKALYLLARNSNGDLIGKLYLKFFGATEDFVRSRISECPDLENIEVLPEFRGQGIGAALIWEAELLCREKCYKKIGLGVSVENVEARKLYERLGYKDSGIGEFDISFMWRSNPREDEIEIREKIVYLVKNI